MAKENIFGIDKDLSAVQVAVFSIYLTLLDYLEPPGIETFKFPVLLNTNFFEADFFNDESMFNANFKEIEFDFILGNPPWKGNGMDEIGNAYLEKRRKNEKDLNKKYEIGIGFFYKNVTYLLARYLSIIHIYFFIFTIFVCL